MTTGYDAMVVQTYKCERCLDIILDFILFLALQDPLLVQVSFRLAKPNVYEFRVLPSSARDLTSTKTTHVWPEGPLCEDLDDSVPPLQWNVHNLCLRLHSFAPMCRVLRAYCL